MKEDKRWKFVFVWTWNSIDTGVGSWKQAKAIIIGRGRLCCAQWRIFWTRGTVSKNGIMTSLRTGRKDSFD